MRVVYLKTANHTGTVKVQIKEYEQNNDRIMHKVVGKIKIKLVITIKSLVLTYFSWFWSSRSGVWCCQVQRPLISARSLSAVRSTMSPNHHQNHNSWHGNDWHMIASFADQRQPHPSTRAMSSWNSSEPQKNYQMRTFSDLWKLCVLNRPEGRDCVLFWHFTRSNYN